jgi:hypothetical protein
MSANTETIYVALLGEGTEVWRPVNAALRAGGLFEIISRNDDPEDELWQFPPGSLVRCERRQLSEGPRLVAVELLRPTTPRAVR